MQRVVNWARVRIGSEVRSRHADRWAVAAGVSGSNATLQDLPLVKRTAEPPPGVDVGG